MQWIRRAFVGIWSGYVGALALGGLIRGGSESSLVDATAAVVCGAALVALATGKRTGLLGVPIAVTLYKLQLVYLHGGLGFALKNLAEAGIIAYFFLSVYRGLAPETEDSFANLEVFHR